MVQSISVGLYRGTNPPEGYRYIQTMLVFEGQGGGKNHALSHAGSGAIEVCRKIAEKAFRFDRFHADKEFPNSEADKIKADCIERDILNPDTKVWLVGHPTKGFISVNNNRVGLVAVRRRYRGMGFGLKLLDHALWKFPRLQAGTQTDNPVVHIYTKLGFRIIELTPIWHGKPRSSPEEA